MLHCASAYSLLSSLFAGRLKHRLYLFAILAIALWLRLHHIGETPFWFDEVGVVQVVKAESLLDIYELSRSHVAAMPLDYLVAWVMSNTFGSSIGVLRTPAAVWGTLSVLAAYLLFSKIGGRSVGLLTALFLAFLSFHIRYSQELRFYSALVFFYLLANLVLLRALERPTHQRWLAFFLTMMVGILFHIYVMLTLINSAIWMALQMRKSAAWRQELGRFSFYSLLTVQFAFAGVWAFLLPNIYQQHSLLEVTPSLIQGIASGLGWRPAYAGLWQLGFISSGLILLFGWIGIASSLWKNPRSRSSALFYSTGVQILLVLAADVWQKYFFVSRQLIFLLPVSFFFAATGIKATAEWINRKVNGPVISRIGINPGSILAAVLTLTVLLSSAFSLSAYYASDRTYVPQICAALQQNWKTGTRVYILPWYETITFEYYLEKQGASPEISPSLVGVSWPMLEETQLDDRRTMLATHPAVSTNREQLLFKMGFRPVAVPGVNQAVNFLWLRSGHEGD